MMDRRGFLKGAIVAAAGLVTAKLPRSQPTEIAVRSHPPPVLDNFGISSAKLANRGTPGYNTFGISGEEIREAIERRAKALESLPPLKDYWSMQRPGRETLLPFPSKHVIGDGKVGDKVTSRSDGKLEVDNACEFQDTFGFIREIDTARQMTIVCVQGQYG